MEVESKSPLRNGTPSADTTSASSAQAIRRRASVACPRCRRMRSKCVYDYGRPPPCKSCAEVGGKDAEECKFPARGEPSDDRGFRRPRARGDTAKILGDTLGVPATLFPTSYPGNPWDNLSETADVIAAIDMFTRRYFQLGFIPKERFKDRRSQNYIFNSPFLLLSILAISARFTPTLRDRYGTSVGAAKEFMNRATAIAGSEMELGPSLERCQAFLLLSIAQQGSGDMYRSNVYMNIAVEMATKMLLHKEETYTLVPDAPKELVIRSESMRRTLWMLHSQGNLHSGPASPVSLRVSDITTLLPCDESDFEAGVEPKRRAALEDTPPGIENPSLTSDSGRSLFASLMQAHHFWGIITRRAIAQRGSTRPWEPQSDYAEMVKRLRDWEKNLPLDHRWSPDLLKQYKAQDLDLAYLGVTRTTQLCNIVIRKAYLNNIIQSGTTDLEKKAFWMDMGNELFQSVRTLYDQILAQFTDRAPDDGPGGQMASFCVYSCGVLAIYLSKYPSIYSAWNIRRAGPEMLKKTMEILRENQSMWPLAGRWLASLKSIKTGKTVVECSMADRGDPSPNPLFSPVTKSPIELKWPTQIPNDNKPGEDSWQIPGTSVLDFTRPSPWPAFPVQTTQLPTPQTPYQSPLMAFSPQPLPQPLPQSYLESLQLQHPHSLDGSPLQQHNSHGLVMQVADFDSTKHAQLGGGGTMLSPPYYPGPDSHSGYVPYGPYQPQTCSSPPLGMPANDRYPNEAPVTPVNDGHVNGTPALPADDGFVNELQHYFEEQYAVLEGQHAAPAREFASPPW